MAHRVGAAPSRGSTAVRCLIPAHFLTDLPERPENAGPAGYAVTPQLVLTISAITNEIEIGSDPRDGGSGLSVAE
jgi:hypothetical protein